MEEKGESIILYFLSTSDVQPLPVRQGLRHIVVVQEDKCFHKKNLSLLLSIPPSTSLPPEVLCWARHYISCYTPLACWSHLC